VTFHDVRDETTPVDACRRQSVTSRVANVVSPVVRWRRPTFDDYYSLFDDGRRRGTFDSLGLESQSVIRRTRGSRRRDTDTDTVGRSFDVVGRSVESLVSSHTSETRPLTRESLFRESRCVTRRRATTSTMSWDVRACDERTNERTIERSNDRSRARSKEKRMK